ncbi:MAG: hypothetical protein B6U89_07295 [Desulfurococcales archaeon ex4484_58]|nr:MAG: hypothetical protein B6U89_07295 [Desulfurococcales archaeon ex4484_58]
MLKDTYKALEKLHGNSVLKPYIFLSNPSRYAELVAVYERTSANLFQKLQKIVDENCILSISSFKYSFKLKE